MVACTGLEPVNVALRGRCVRPLHQQAMCNYFNTRSHIRKEEFDNLLIFPFRKQIVHTITAAIPAAVLYQ